MKSAVTFADLTKKVHLINDLILSDLAYGKYTYEQEALDFSKHLLAIKYWFARISHANKKKYVLALLHDVRSAWTLSLLLKSMWNCRPKDAVMSICETPMLSAYDQVPMDHNRTAQPMKDLAQVMINGRQWFHTLDPGSQAMVLAELVMAASGPIMWEVLKRAQAIFQRYREEQLHNLLECIAVADADVKDTKTSPSKAAAATPMEGEDSTRKTLIKSSAVQLDVALSVWNATIKSIRDSQKLEEFEMTFKDGSKRKIWKVNRANPERIETVDFIQMLPAVVSKRILSFLSRAQLTDYAKVNNYWAFLVDELKAELAARDKLKIDLQKLQDLIFKYDTSMEDLHMGITVAGGTDYNTAPSSVCASAGPSGKKQRLSVLASMKSSGAPSFKNAIEKLTYEIRKHRSIRNLADLSERLDQRGAADENLWRWCKNILKHCKNHLTEQEEEGVLRFKDTNFSCPLMKSSIDIPLKCVLVKDPSHVGPVSSKKSKTILMGAMKLPRNEDAKRYSLWSRDFSSLYKVSKVASYQSPV